MRTTLKRGIGRGAAFNGDGKAVLPPGALSPVARYRQPPPPPRSGMRTVAKVLGWIGVVLLMLAGGLAGGIYLYAHETVKELAPHSRAVIVAQQKLSVPLPGQPAIALVLGYDKRFAGVDRFGNSRSDTVMLLRADPKTKTVSMLSFPRDMLVDIHCPGHAVYRDRINAAFSLCGPQGTVETVKALTGLPINYLVAVNFRGFVRVVDKLGGAWIDVDRRYLNTHGGPGGFATINLQPGYQLLGGYQALDYVRYRHTDSDIYRVARQQQFVRAFKDQLHARLDPLKVLGLVKDITRNVEVGQGGGHPLSLRTIASWALFAYNLPPGHFFQSKIQGLEGYAELTTPEANVNKAVAQFANPDVASPGKATDVALGVKPKHTAPPPRQTTVNVLNGNGVSGSAANASYSLGQRGYITVQPPNGQAANAPTQDYFHTKVYFDPKQRGAKLAARKVANLFGSADVARIPASIAPLANDAMLVVVVGQTFHGNLVATPVDETPKREPANVTSGASASLQYVRDRTKKVPFPLMVPTVIERSSWIDHERPARLYRIDPDRKHKALRLTFRTSDGRYWGVEETDWTEAPILGERNFTRHIKGRRYELHYSGPNLHMVVLRTPRATYWVVNSLLDDLSNETMLAIAKGLKPSASLK